MATYGQGFPDLRRWTLWELAMAWGMVPVLRNERIRDTATATRLAQQDKKNWSRGIKDLS